MENTPIIDSPVEQPVPQPLPAKKPLRILKYITGIMIAISLIPTFLLRDFSLYFVAVFVVSLVAFVSSLMLLKKGQIGFAKGIMIFALVLSSIVGVIFLTIVGILIAVFPIFWAAGGGGH